MSADFINSIGARGPSIYGPSGPRGTGAAAGASGAPDAKAPGEASPAAAPEGFSPTAEAGESSQDTQAGEARASQIFSAWAPNNAAATPSAGQLSIQGGENTAVSHRVHGVQNGQHTSSSGPEAGFTGGTVFSSRPPG